MILLKVIEGCVRCILVHQLDPLCTDAQAKQCRVDRDKMVQDAQIKWAQLDYFICGQFLKKKYLGSEDWSNRKPVTNFLVNMPFLYCNISTFSNQFTKPKVLME